MTTKAKERWGEDFKIYGYAEPTFGIQIPAPEEGFTLRVHKRADCRSEYCAIHNPSDHPLKDAPFNWRADKGELERLCEHGVGHPDRDSLDFAIANLKAEPGYEEGDEKYFGSHGCDGCC